MTSDELAAAAATLFPGPGSMKRMAAALGLSYSTMRDMLRGREEIWPETAERVRRLLDAAERGAAPVGPPPDGLSPHLDALRYRAEAAGWAASMVLEAVAAWLERRKRDG